MENELDSSATQAEASSAAAAGTRSACRRPGGAETHEPPVIIGGGSLHVDFKQEIVRHGFNPPGHPRPFKYKWESEEVGHVATVQVITEEDDGHFSCERYNLPERVGCQVRVWLRQLKLGGGPFDYEPVAASDEPQLIVAGNPPQMELDRELTGPQMTHKFKQPFRYEHPGYDRHFRIAKWEIFNLQTGTFEFRGVPGESYQLYIFFHEVISKLLE